MFAHKHHARIRNLSKLNRAPILGKKTPFGFSLIELLLGVSLGLFVVSGALTLYASQLAQSKRIMLEMRINQELRITLDLISRQLRNSGYWNNALNGTLAGMNGSAPIQNPYASINYLETNSSLVFYQSLDTNDIINSNENLGFRLVDGSVQAQLGSGNWQALTDPKALTITALSITPTIKTISSVASTTSTFNPCSKACTDINSCPQFSIRSYKIVLAAVAPRDPTLVRALEQTVRVRNDEVKGVCPL